MKKYETEPQRLIYRLQDLKEAHPRLATIEKWRPEFVAELSNIQKSARVFGKEVISPVASKVDQLVEQDHDYFHWDFVRAGAKHHFLSYFIPKPFGGMGYYTTHFAILMEELCSFCPGVANIFGAHALGISPLLMMPDIRTFERFLRPVAESEKAGRPDLFALAITEPGAGSDMEDAAALNNAKLSCFARKTKGGYIVDGMKVFISNGSVAKYIWGSAVLDRKNPSGSFISFVITNDTPGFSVGSIEKKLGQRACPAAELIFDDMFVPVENRIGDESTSARLLSSVLGASRAPVAAIATGIARGAFQALLKYLNGNKVNGSYLFERQVVQMKLVDMMMKIQAARQLYLDATLTCDMFGIPSLLGHPSFKLLEMLPQSIMKSGPTAGIITSDLMYRTVKELATHKVSDRTISNIAALSSIAKYTASDLAMEIVSSAMEIMGADGPVVEFGVEKFYRDAKLTQIYEGTNQINRLFAFDALLQ